MNEVLQIIGSIASIASIPLAIYLFLRSQAQRYVEIRKEIVNRLSFQIGEGRELSIFEIQAMIASKVRQNRIRTGIIIPDQIIEDLVAEIINSPLLESARKEEVFHNLRELHSLGKLYGLVASDPKIFEDFLLFVRDTKNEPEKSQQIEQAIAREVSESKKSRSAATPEIFGALATLAGTFAAAISTLDISGFLQILPKIFDSEIITSVFLGIFVSAISAFITYLIIKQD